MPAKEIKSIAISSLYGGSGAPIGSDYEPVASALYGWIAWQKKLNG